jgi:hypothetical protein
VAGDGSWEHIVVNVDSVINDWDDVADDSVTIIFKIYCIKDTALASPESDIYAVFDDIVLYGSKVVNGDFETGTPEFRNWSGTSARTDGYWVSGVHKTSSGGYFGACESSSFAHAGSENFCFYYEVGNYSKINDYCEVRQRIDVLGQ